MFAGVDALHFCDVLPWASTPCLPTLMLANSGDV